MPSSNVLQSNEEIPQKELAVRSSSKSKSAAATANNYASGQLHYRTSSNNAGVADSLERYTSSNINSSNRLNNAADNAIAAGERRTVSNSSANYNNNNSNNNNSSNNNLYQNHSIQQQQEQQASQALHKSRSQNHLNNPYQSQPSLHAPSSALPSSASTYSNQYMVNDHFILFCCCHTCCLTYTLKFAVLHEAKWITAASERRQQRPCRCRRRQWRLPIHAALVERSL